MALATLLQIQQKARLLTRTPGIEQLTTDQLNQYINTFIMFNFPQQLRLYNLRKTFTFYTQPNVDVYNTETDNPNDPLYNFSQNIVTIHPPVFLAGIPGYYTQWRDQFFGSYPKFDTINVNTGLFGNGTAGPFSGFLLQNNGIASASINTVQPQYTGVLQNNVIISTIDDNNTGLILVDYPQTNELGILAPPTYLYGPNPITNAPFEVVDTTNGGGAASGSVPAGFGQIGQYFIIGGQTFVVVVADGNLATTAGVASGTFNTANGDFTFSAATPNTDINFYQVPSYGTVNYVTGAYTAIFPSVTASIGTQQPIVATTVPYQAGKPTGVLFYDQKFTIRPVPDKVYAIQFEADVVPTQLLEEADMPTIEQWWQYIAYGAARLIFQDRMDLDSTQLIEPEFREQEMLVQRSTITTRVNSRTETIYTIGKNYGASGWGWFGQGGWPY